MPRTLAQLAILTLSVLALGSTARADDQIPEGTYETPAGTHTIISANGGTNLEHTDHNTNIVDNFTWIQNDGIYLNAATGKTDYYDVTRLVDLDGNVSYQVWHYSGDDVLLSTRTYREVT